VGKGFQYNWNSHSLGAKMNEKVGPPVFTKVKKFKRRKKTLLGQVRKEVKNIETLRSASEKLAEVAHKLEYLKKPKSFAAVEEVRADLRRERHRSGKSLDASLSVLPDELLAKVERLLNHYIYNLARHKTNQKKRLNEIYNGAIRTDTRFKRQYEKVMEQYREGHLSVKRVEKWHRECEKIWDWNDKHPDNPKNHPPQPTIHRKKGSSKERRWDGVNSRLGYYRYMRTQNGIDNPHLTFKIWLQFVSRVFQAFQSEHEAWKARIKTLPPVVYPISGAELRKRDFKFVGAKAIFEEFKVKWDPELEYGPFGYFERLFKR
jgi:hypothetical protein